MTDLTETKIRLLALTPGPDQQWLATVTLVENPLSAYLVIYSALGASPCEAVQLLADLLLAQAWEATVGPAPAGFPTASTWATKRVTSSAGF